MRRYFAYGSNLVRDRMRERGAPFSAAAPALLRGHRLTFDKRGFDGAGRATIAPAADGAVHGVVYDLQDGALEALRGFESGYDLVEVEVEVASAGGGTEHLRAMTFVARPDRRTNQPPTRTYVALVLQGVEEHGLPPEARAAVERAAKGSGAR